MTQDMFANIEITAPEPRSYLALSSADRTLVDRAIFDNIVRGQQGNYTFTAEERGRHNGRDPNSKQLESDINRLRENAAVSLRNGGRAELQRDAADGPAAATAMLEALRAVNGIECGCSTLNATPLPVNLNRELSRGR